MTDNRSRPRPVDFAWNDPEPVQQEPTGPALGNYPAEPEGLWAGRIIHSSIGHTITSSITDRRRTVGEKIARFLDKLADRARGWH